MADTFPNNPIYLFLDTGFVEKIKVDWLKKNVHIVGLISAEKKLIYSNTCTQEESDFIMHIAERCIVNFRGLIVVMTGELPHTGILLSIVDRLSKQKYCSNLNLDHCQDYKFVTVSARSIVLYVSFKTTE